MMAKIIGVRHILYIKCLNWIIFQFTKGKGVDHTSPLLLWNFVFKTLNARNRLLIIETFRFKDENDYDLTSSFFAYSQNIVFRESFSLPFFTRKVSTVILSEGGYALSRSQNDKTSNVWYLVFATFTLKLVVEWRRLPLFPAKMTLVHARALLSIEKI